MSTTIKQLEIKLLALIAECMEERHVGRLKIQVYSGLQDECRCRGCGDKAPPTLHFHHVVEETKEFNISAMNQQGIGPVAKELRELFQTVPLCPSCHQKYSMGTKAHRIRAKRKHYSMLAKEISYLPEILKGIDRTLKSDQKRYQKLVKGIKEIKAEAKAILNIEKD